MPSHPCRWGQRRCRSAGPSGPSVMTGRRSSRARSRASHTASVSDAGERADRVHEPSPVGRSHLPRPRRSPAAGRRARRARPSALATGARAAAGPSPRPLQGASTSTRSNGPVTAGAAASWTTSNGRRPSRRAVSAIRPTRRGAMSAARPPRRARPARRRAATCPPARRMRRRPVPPVLDRAPRPRTPTLDPARSTGPRSKPGSERGSPPPTSERHAGSIVPGDASTPASARSARTSGTASAPPTTRIDSGALVASAAAATSASGPTRRMSSSTAHARKPVRAAIASGPVSVSASGVAPARRRKTALTNPFARPGTRSTVAETAACAGTPARQLVGPEPQGVPRLGRRHRGRAAGSPRARSLRRAGAGDAACRARARSRTRGHEVPGPSAPTEHGKRRFEYAPSSITRRITSRATDRAVAGVIPDARPRRTGRRAPTRMRPSVCGRRARPRRAAPRRLPRARGRHARRPRRPCPGCRRCAGDRSPRARTFTLVPTQARRRAGPGREGAHPAHDLVGRALPVDQRARLLRSSARRSAHPPAPVRRTPPCGSIRSTPTSSSAPIFARRAPSEPASSSGRIGSSSWFRIGPVSSPSSIRITVTPVRISPAAIARWTGVAPRHRGSREKWRLIGAERREAERLATQDAGRRRRPRSRRAAASASAVAPGPSRTPPTSSSGAACAVAAFATAVGVSAAPRPASFGGFVTTERQRQLGLRRDRVQRRHGPRIVAEERDPKRHRRRIVADARARPTAVCAGAARRARARSGGAPRAPRCARRRRAGRCRGCR